MGLVVTTDLNASESAASELLSILVTKVDCMKSEGIVLLRRSALIDMPEGALTLMALPVGTDTEQDGAAIEQLADGVASPGDGIEPIVARKGDSARLLPLGFSVTDLATSPGRRSS